jgi:hypothetical protein
MGTPAEFCENALECIGLASGTANSVHRTLLLDIAIKWLHLAGATRQEIELVRNGERLAA